MKLENKEVTETKEQELQKREVPEEQTVAGRYYSPLTDIVEAEKSLLVTMDMPGVQKENVKIKLENNTLEVEGHIDFSLYQSMNPVYTEYSVGHYTRKFSLSNSIDSENIEANLANGVLTLTLPKSPEMQPKQIPVS